MDDCVNKPDAPECITDERAFFVSPTGDDTASGTKAAPLRTLEATLGKVTADKKRIYVCDGSYAEDLVLEAKHSGVSIFGGFTCEWAASSAKPTFGKSALALKLTGATGVAIAGLAFDAADAKTSGGSSIAAFVSSAEVTFKNVRLKAGAGLAGEDGTLAAFTYPDATALQGKNGDAPGNGAATSVTCEGDNGTSTTGGAGGASGFAGDPGTPNGSPNGGSVSQCEINNTGGGNGQPGTSPPAAIATTKHGLLAEQGWQPYAGTSGAKGGAGQGGGGGGGYNGGHGGGGAAGGCGGAGGGGGKGGGASIALASLQSTVRIEGSSLVASNAGNGGHGVDGQPGQTPGGTRGLASGVGASCNGGNGGPGGNGAAGAGGPGGVSIGILYKGATPSVDPATSAATTVGTPAAGGVGGKPGVAPGGNDGPVGIADKLKNASELE
jgi:hypothetical protein